MAELLVPFDRFLPDQPGYRNPGLLRAINAIPRTSSYGPLRKLNVISANALSARCLGAISARDASGNVYVYAGDASALYETVAYTFTDESKAGGYSTAADDTWEFAVWKANDVVIATNYTDAVQSIAIGGGASGAFADMITSTNTPKAKHVGIVGEFVVLGFTNDSTDGEKTNRVWWSAIGDETDFDPSASTQSDYQDLATGGRVQRIIGGTEYGLIFQADMVRAMRYIGQGLVFDILPINYVPGTPLPRSVVAYAGRVFYIAEDGFMALTGVTPQHIGNTQVDRFFWDQFDPSNAVGVSAALDPVNKIVAWVFPGTGASSNLPNKILIYRYDIGKWAEGEIDTEQILTTETQGYTLDGLDTVGTDIDDSSVFDESFDSDKWKGGAFRFAAITQAHELAFFSGATLPATFITGDMQPQPGRRWQVGSARPLIDGGKGRVSMSGRTRLQDSVSYGSASDINTDGICPLRSEGRYQRARLSLTGSTSWSHVQGLMLNYTLLGER